jgi:hypothetical protein
MRSEKEISDIESALSLNTANSESISLTLHSLMQQCRVEMDSIKDQVLRDEETTIKLTALGNALEAYIDRLTLLCGVVLERERLIHQSLLEEEECSVAIKECQVRNRGLTNTKG